MGITPSFGLGFDYMKASIVFVSRGRGRGRLSRKDDRLPSRKCASDWFDDQALFLIGIDIVFRALS